MNTTKTFFIVVITLVSALLLSSMYTHYKERELSLLLKHKILEQDKTLISLSEISDANGVDEVTESIIRDCESSKRARFEQLLNKLNLISESELSELEALFDVCAPFFSERKAMMVARLEREFEVYADYVGLLKVIEEAEAELLYPVNDWSEIVALEKSRRDLLLEQVQIQGTIIEAIKSSTQNSDEFQAMLVRAAQVSQEAATLNRSIDDVRQRLNSI